MDPWDRRVIGDLLVKLREAQVGVIMMPILFSEPDRLGGDEQLANLLQGSFVVIAQVGTSQTNKNSVIHVVLQKLVIHYHGYLNGMVC